VASKKKLKRRLKWATEALERAAFNIAREVRGGEWEPRVGDVVEQISTKRRGVLQRNLVGEGWQVQSWGSERAGGWWDSTEILLADPDVRVVREGPQKAPDVVSRFLPSGTPPTLRKDAEAAVEGLIEAARTFSASRHAGSSGRSSEELLQAAIKAGGLIRSAHGAPVQDCICNETTYGMVCPVHGKHWAVREAEGWGDWEPAHGMSLVSHERETKGTKGILLRVEPLPGSSIKWHVLVKTDPMIVYPYSNDEGLKKIWRPKVSDLSG
jgi:hypothetical protein